MTKKIKEFTYIEKETKEKDQKKYCWAEMEDVHGKKFWLNWSCLSKDRVINSPEGLNSLPLELKNLILKWEDKIKELDRTFKSEYPLKLGCIRFIFKDKIHIFEAKSFAACRNAVGLSYGNRGIELFDAVGRSLKDDLIKLGCIYVLFLPSDLD